jgi:Tfp pilus assembly protein PilW
MKTQIAKLKNGYTLIEVLVYGVIFSMFLLLITQIFLTMKNTSAGSSATVNLQQNYARIFSDLNQTIRSATSVSSPTSGNSAASLSLNDGSIVYQVVGGVLQKVDGGTPIPLTDDGINIADINFENVGEATLAATVRIRMTVESNYILEGGRRISEDFQTAIGIRE